MNATIHSQRAILVVVVVLSLLAATAAAANSGIQTHFGGVSFAGGMSYDAEHQTVYVTGQVGPHSCFVGVLKRVKAPSEGAQTKSAPVEPATGLKFLSKQTFSERAICQTIAFRRDVSRPGNALLLSLSEEGGLLTDKREEGSRRAMHYGGLVALQYSADGTSSHYAPDHSVLMYQTAPVTVPRSITNDPKHTNRVFVASMTSDSKAIEYRNALGTPHENDGLGLTTVPNLTPGGGLLKYGNNFAMTVESIRLATEFSDAQIQWRKPFGVKRNGSSVRRTGVTVNQILSHRIGGEGGGGDDDDDDDPTHALYVVGSVIGSSPAFGEPESENPEGTNRKAGFVTKLDPDTGDLLSSRRIRFESNDGSGKASGDSLVDTYVEAVCEGAGDGQDDAIFVVGSYARPVPQGNRTRSLQAETQTDDGIGEDDDDDDDDDAVDDDGVVGEDDDDDDDAFFDDDDAATGEYDDDDDDDDDDGNLLDGGKTFGVLDFDDDDRANGDNVFDDDDDIVDDDDDDDAYSDGEASDEGPTIATPFVAKLRASTLETVWQRDFESTTDSRALGCGFDADSNTVYLAGLVEDGGELVGRTTSLLGDDVFLMRLDATDGAVVWAKQLGTSMDDRLAYGGSGLAVLEGQKGVLLMGDTKGNLYSIPDKDSEIFVVEVDADGNLPEITETSGIDYSSEASDLEISNPVNTEGAEVQTDEKESEKDNGSDESTPEDANPIRTSIRIGHVVYLFLTIGLVTVGCSGISYVLSKKKRASTERALVFSYLQNFDLEDIDVKQAATGGWHGTYVGNLAQGLNVREEDQLYGGRGSDGDAGAEDGTGNTTLDSDSVKRQLNKLSHSSVVRDILFMDYDESIYKDGDSKNGTKADNDAKNRDNLVKDPILYDSDPGKGDDDEKEDDDPWGSEII